MEVSNELKQVLQEALITDARYIDGRLCGLIRMVFTVGIAVNIEEDGCYGYRYCYGTRAEAKEALDNYINLSDHPPGNWRKRKGKGGELSNPKIIKSIKTPPPGRW